MLRLVVIATLPFILLIRGSIWLHTDYRVYPIIALAGGLLMTFVLLSIYLMFFYDRITGYMGGRSAFKKRSAILLLILISYCGYGILYISGKNVKSPDIASEFRSLHPVLRLGVSTILLADKDLVITDADRVPEDYERMGLSRKSQSLHYRQSNGYVHAMDIRTQGRGGIRNFVLKWYFRLMGFNVLRHGGTGDHLHISLLSHDRPHAY